MARKPRSYTAEFKAEAVRLCNVGDRSVPQVARDLGVLERVLRAWVSKARTQTATLKPEATPRDLEAENARLRAQVRRLEMDRDILKKAAAFFAKENE